MNLTTKLTALVADIEAVGGTAEVVEQYLNGYSLDCKRGSTTLRIWLTRTGAFDSAHRTDVRVDLATTIRSITGCRKALGLS